MTELVTKVAAMIAPGTGAALKSIVHKKPDHDLTVSLKLVFKETVMYIHLKCGEVHDACLKAVWACCDKILNKFPDQQSVKLTVVEEVTKLLTAADELNKKFEAKTGKLELLDPAKEKDKQFVSAIDSDPDIHHALLHYSERCSNKELMLELGVLVSIIKDKFGTKTQSTLKLDDKKLVASDTIALLHRHSAQLFDEANVGTAQKAEAKDGTAQEAAEGASEVKDSWTRWQRKMHQTSS